MEARKLQVGEVVQINAKENELWGGCIAVVDEPKIFGALIAILVPGARAIYLRVLFKDIEPIGKVVWDHTYTIV